LRGRYLTEDPGHVYDAHATTHTCATDDTATPTRPILNLFHLLTVACHQRIYRLRYLKDPDAKPVF
jgi:hypothetical protein